MGIANIIQSHISDNSSAVLNKVGEKLPEVSVDTSKYSPAFVKFMMLVGLYSATKLTMSGINYLGSFPKYKPLTKKQIQEKYGRNCWALVVDVARNEEYCMYLAKQGVNLILLGEEDDIKVARDMVNFEYDDIRMKQIIVDWSNKSINYEELVQNLKDFDIAFMILPKFEQASDESTQTYNEVLPPFEHYYLMVRHFGPVLKWRCYQSAIILPGSKNYNKIIKGNGVRQGLISCMDSFMRTLNYEVDKTLDVITNRGGSVEGCFAALGKTSIYS